MSLNIIKKIARINPYDDRIFKYFNWDLKSVPKEVLEIQYRKGEAKILARKYKVKIRVFYDTLHDIGVKLKGISKAMRQYRLKGKEEPSREEIARLHEEEGLNIPAIAKKLGFSQCYIRNRFKRDRIDYNIPKRRPKGKNKKTMEIKYPDLEKTEIIRPNLEKKAEPDEEDRGKEIDFETYKELENIAQLDEKDLDYVKEMVRLHIGEMYEDIIRGFSALNGKKLSTKLICSSLFRVVTKLGYTLSEINTNNDLYLESIAKSFLPEMREEFKRIRKDYNLTREDRLKYMLSRLR